MESVVVAPRSQSRFRAFLENVFYIASAIGLALLIQAFIVRPFIVSGASMDPTIKNKQYLLIDELSYRFREPARGDVIVFKAPPEPSKYYIKRIIGLPGDTVEINGQTVTIKNEAHPQGLVLKEPFITHIHSDIMKAVVPQGAYFVMGDNRAGSYDSRSWGTVPRDDIRGRALLRLLPLNTINLFPGKVTYD